MAFRRSSVTRMLVLVVAIAAGAWFAVGIRQAHDTASASTIVSSTHRLSEAQGKHVASLLNAAGFLNPDTEVDLLRAQLAADRGERELAERIATSVVHKEPLNVEAWQSLAEHSTNARTLIHSFEEIKHLVRTPG